MAERGSEDLHRLVEEALTPVAVVESDDVTAATLRGSGFFVAPGLVITCAHVVSAGLGEGADPVGRETRLRVRQGLVSGDVVWAGPVSGERGPLLDLAVIRLREAVEHECVRLSERPVLGVDSAWAYGYAVGPRNQDPPQVWTGSLTVGGTMRGALLLRGDTFPVGSSGGPLVDPVGAGVCAVVKANGRDGERGLAIPLSALGDSEDPAAVDLLGEIWEKHDDYHLNRAEGVPEPGSQGRWRHYGPLFVPGLRRRTLAGLGSDQPSKIDLLGSEGEAEMLAMLAIARTTTPPLAIALLGEWGAGKSSTMEQMRARVAALTERVRRQQELQSAFVANVRQVRFNAWHYAEDHLWAGLIDHLFRELATDPVQEQPPLVSIEEVQRRRVRLRRELEQAKSDVARLQAAAHRSAAPTGRATALGHPLRGPRLLWTEAGTIVRSGWANRRVLALWIAVFAAALAVWAVAGSWLAAAVPLALGAGAAVQSIVRRAQAVHGALRRIAIEAEGRLEQDLRKANDQVTVIADRLAQVDAAVRLSQFLRRRAEEPSPYEPYRSLLSQVRRDLEQLELDLAEAHQQWLWRTEPDTGTLPPLQRIILYIDDLDRCSPQRVVELLAAVHLMLALELFVVVVAVDPKWLIRALRIHHHGLFGPDPGSEPADSDSVSPLDYLDKIFQVPFTISRPGEDATARYLRSLLGPAQAPGSAASSRQPVTEAEAEAAPVQSRTAAGTSSLFAEERPSVAIRHMRALRPDTLQLHANETDFMTLLGALLPTPRAAKKLVNLYRLARISIPVGDLDAFVATEHQALQILLAVLVGFPGAAQQIFTALAREAEDADVRHVLSALVQRDSSSAAADACRRTVAVLEQIASRTTMTTTVQNFQQWIPLVTRFSFHTVAWRGTRTPDTSDVEMPGRTDREA